MIIHFNPSFPYFGHEPTGEQIMAWASEQAPAEVRGDGWAQYRRPIRLEIVAEGGEEISLASHPAMSKVVYDNRRFVARVYLADPRCIPGHADPNINVMEDECECGPIAERRLA
jgi:hypothetical protein